MKSKDRVCIAYPHAGNISAELNLDLINIARYRADKFDSIVAVGNVSLLVRTRNVIVKQFLETTDAAWLLMIDSDQQLPLEAFDKLCEAVHDKDRPIVAGLVFAAFWTDQQELVPVPVVYRWDDEEGITPMHDYPTDELIQIDAAGTGCLMIHRSVFEKMRENATENQGADWCFFMDGPINGRWYGEDLLFSRKLTALGFPIYAHTGAILPHKKDFWLDDRHHTGWLQAHTN
jgi:hypothetical protein